MDIKEINKQHAEIRFYGNIGGWFVNGDSFSYVLDYVAYKGYHELTLRWHCYGGSVFEGNVIYNAMQRSELNINIVIDGVAASMGCYILPSIENVFIADNAYGMIHRPAATDEGDADSHLQTAKLLQDMESNFIKRLTERTGLSAEDIKSKWLDGNDHWLNAEEMVNYGFAKSIVPATAKNIKDLDASAIAEMKLESVYDRFAACLQSTTEFINQNKSKSKMDKQLLIATFGLTGVTAESSDTAVLQALQTKFNDVEARIKTLEAEAKTKLDAAINKMIDVAKSEGKIIVGAGQTIQDVVETYRKIGQQSGVNALAMVLNSIAKTTPIASRIVPEGKGGSDVNEPKTFSDLVALGESVLTNWKENRKEDYVRLYKAEFGHEPKFSN